MPNRVLRDGILDSRAINSLSESAELFYRRLMSVVDDYGRIEFDEEILRLRCFPRRLETWTVGRLTDACHETATCLSDDGHPLVLVFKHPSSTKIFLQINNFRQRVRAGSSKCPEPDGQTSVEWRSDDGHMTVIRQPSDGHVTVIRRSDDGHMTAIRAQARTQSKSKTETADVDVLKTNNNNNNKPKNGTPGSSEYPECSKAVREHFPATEDIFISRIVQNTAQRVLSENLQLDRVDDALIAKAVRKLYTNKQESAGLFLTSVPQCIVTWLTPKAPSSREYFPPGYEKTS